MSAQRRFDRTRRVYELDAGLSDEDKRCVGDHVMFTKILTPSKTGKDLHRQNKKSSWKLVKINIGILM